MGFIYQTPETVGGTVLIIERIESQNYVPGVSGWAIEANGDAEFADLTARGTFISGSGTGPHIEITSVNANTISFFSGDATETQPGFIFSGGGGVLSTNIGSPVKSGSGLASIQLESFGGGSLIDMFADDVQLSNNLAVAGNTKLGAVGSTVKAMRHGNTAAVTNAASQLVIPHGLGVAPAAVLLGPQSHYARIQAVGVANITVEFRNPAGGALVPATAVSLYWLAIA
jgi:hypothetical protein